MMQELSSFGSGQRKEATGVQEDSAIAPNTATSNTGSFPMTNFSSAPSSAGNQNQDSGARAAPDEEAADQLRKELELFAQDDDDEEGALMTTGYDNQPQNAHAQPQARDYEDDSNELQEYETFFDGGH